MRSIATSGTRAARPRQPAWAAAAACVRRAATKQAGARPRGGAGVRPKGNPPLGLGRVTIIGLGFDATEIPRIAAAIDRYGDRFTKRIFTDGEISYCMRRRDPAIHFAGR